VTTDVDNQMLEKHPVQTRPLDLLPQCLGFLKELSKLCRFRLNQDNQDGSFVQRGSPTGPSGATLVSAFMETIFNILTGTVPKWVSF